MTKMKLSKQTKILTEGALTMSVIALIVLICIYYAICGVYEKRIQIGEKSKKIGKVLSLFSVIAPIIVAVVFAFLFSFVLKGRIGFFPSVAMAILLTPLDRYNTLIYTYSQALAVPFSIGVLVFVYIVIFYTNPELKIKK